MATVFITTYSNDSGENDVYIRVHPTFTEAWDEALDDLVQSMNDHWVAAPKRQIDTYYPTDNDGEPTGEDAHLSIVNACGNGYVFERYTIKTVDVNI